MFVRPTQAIEIFRNVSTPFGNLAIKIHGHFVWQKCSPKNLVFRDRPIGLLFIAIFAEVTENECIMHRRSHIYEHYLLIIIFKFNCKSDFTMIKIFVNFRFVGQ